MLYLWFADIQVAQGFKNGSLTRNSHPVCALFILEHNDC